MKKFLCLLGFCLFGLLAAGATGGTVNVKLHYTGSGSVDDQHKIFVVLFDSPDFVNGGGSAPLAVKAATGKDESVTFSDVSATTVYVATSYDPSGKYDGQSGPPPSGSSLGMYSKTPGKPEPISVPAGKTVQVTVSFDDSYKMP